MKWFILNQSKQIGKTFTKSGISHLLIVFEKNLKINYLINSFT
ncbi:hypothetical protein C8N25_1159 [Algoriphagus antarcticus]|uniref:Uncharacterized protein n=1 Tax=Algoriphagus antarcticus TaxID=238540 RepID=A0A3E0DQH2_9BACT|nr:hypothetical protein C8N25_1159 [Algoriphagus antarcticus]